MLFIRYNPWKFARARYNTHVGKRGARMKAKRKVGKPRIYKAPERLTIIMPGSLMRQVEKWAAVTRRSLSATVVDVLTDRSKSEKIDD